MSTEPIDLAVIIATAIRDHQMTTGMQVASGVTCRCGYWNGNERAGVDRPVGCGGLTWHQAQEAATAIRAELEAAKAEAWDEGFSAGWDECRDPDAFVNDKWDSKTPNPYEGKE